MPVLLPTPLPMLPATAAFVVSASADTLRVGDYIIGDGECFELYGHPDIRY